MRANGTKTVSLHRWSMALPSPTLRLTGAFVILDVDGKSAWRWIEFQFPNGPRVKRRYQTFWITRLGTDWPGWLRIDAVEGRWPWHQDFEAECYRSGGRWGKRLDWRRTVALWLTLSLSDSAPGASSSHTPYAAHCYRPQLLLPTVDRYSRYSLYTHIQTWVSIINYNKESDFVSF